MSKLPVSAAQKKVAEEILVDFATYKSQVLAWYTGSGKTNIFLYLIKRLIEENPKVKIGVSTYLHTNIKMQTSLRTDDFDLDHHTIKTYDRNYEDKNVYLFNPQTIWRRDDFPFKFDYLIIDEAHVATGELAKMFPKIKAKFLKPTTKILGCTATPWAVMGSKMFAGAKCHFRGIDRGFFEDKRISDFHINVERFNIKVRAIDISRKNGNLKSGFLKRSFKTIKESSIDKVDELLKHNKKKLGNKCLIIVNPGNFCDIAKSIKKRIGASALCLIDNSKAGGKREARMEEEKTILSQFRNDPKIKYLVVVNKCQIGFDMPELTSTVDLTMTRNISLLIQRWGRLARHFEGFNVPKNYFYVVDNSMTVEESEWLLGTSVEYALGSWEIPKRTRDVYRRKTKLFDISKGERTYGIGFKSLMDKYIGQKHLSSREISFFKQDQVETNYWTRENLIAECKKYSSRTELSAKNRYIYKKMKKYYEADLNKIFPRKVKTWTIEKCLAEAKKYPSLNSFRRAEPSAFWRLEYEGKKDLARKIIYGE